MSLVSEAIQSLIEHGKIVHEFTLKGMKFTMEVLSTEDQILADSLVDPDKLREKYKADANSLNTFRDTIDKYRAVAQIAFAIKKVNGTPPVDTSLSLEEQFKQRVSFRDELTQLGVVMLDKLILEYNQVIIKQRDFLKDADENAGK